VTPNYYASPAKLAAALEEPAEEELPLDPEGVAAAAGLRYVSDTMPGIRRRKAGGRLPTSAPTASG
jgi:hypothetical protein